MPSRCVKSQERNNLRPATLPLASDPLLFRRTRQQHRAAAVSSAGCLPEPSQLYGVFHMCHLGCTPSSPGAARATSVILVTRNGTVCTLACCATETSTISGVRACGPRWPGHVSSTTPRASWANGVSTISRCALEEHQTRLRASAPSARPSVAHTWPRLCHAESSVGPWLPGQWNVPPLLLRRARPERPKERVLRKAGAAVGETRCFGGRVSWRSPDEVEHTQQRSA